MLNEKSVSRTQQRLMGQAYGVRKWMDTNGKNGLDPKDIDSKYRETIVEIAKNMEKKSLKDFASTKHKKIPEEVGEGKIPTIIPYLNPEANLPKKNKTKKMQNLADYREFINKKNK
jgi:hypothetical protein